MIIFINISLIKFKSKFKVSIFDLTQPGLSSVSSHPVDPNELLCSQLGLSQSNQSWTDENWPRLGPTPIIIRVQISKYHLKQVGFLHYLKHCCHRCLIEFSGKKDPNIDNNRRVKMRQRYLYLQITKLSLSLKFRISPCLYCCQTIPPTCTSGREISRLHKNSNFGNNFPILSSCLSG